jgi:hypothetical protein
LQFLTKNSRKLDLNITLMNNQITSSTNTKFLGLTIEETSWKAHINQIMLRLSSACYAIRVITPLMTEDILKMIYNSYVHSIITYGVIFGGNSPHGTHIFKNQKRIVRIMTKSRRRDSCRQLFKIEILPLKSQYILSTLLFVVKNNDLFTTNQEIHNINTRSNTNLHPLTCNLMVFIKGVYFSGIKLYNHLPPYLKNLSKEIKLFKPALKRFLFYTHFI